MNPVRYAIILPAYNEAEELPRTLEAVRRAMDAQKSMGECIVVDNNSSDDTAAIASQWGADRVIFEPVNQIARARNAGAAASEADFYIFVDADTRIESRLLSQALDLLEAGVHVGGGSVVRFEGSISRFGRISIAIWERLSRGLNVAAGSFIFCRREAFLGIGGFDEKLYAGEEVRFSRMLKKWGGARGQKFEILTDAPVRTSPRKLNWYSGPQILGWVLFLMLMPLAVRSRRLCGFWYKRPKG